VNSQVIEPGVESPVRVRDLRELALRVGVVGIIGLLALILPACTPLAPTGGPPDAGVGSASITPIDTGGGADGPPTVGPDGAGTCGGRDCLGGECLNDVCQPVQVVGSLDRPEVLAVDSTHAFVIAHGQRILRIPLDGGTAQPIATGLIQGAGLSLTADDVYFADRGLSSGNGALRRVSKLVSGDPTDILTGLELPSGLIVDGDSLYFYTYRGTSAMDGIFVTDAAGGSGMAQALASQQDGPSGMAVDADHVYCVNRASSNAGGGGVYRIRTGGGGMETLVQGLRFPSTLAIDDSAAVYYSGADLGGQEQMVIWRVPKVGGDPIEVYRDRVDVAAVVVDATDVY
jgi:hypothetical protein